MEEQSSANFPLDARAVSTLDFHVPFPGGLQRSSAGSFLFLSLHVTVLWGG